MKDHVPFSLVLCHYKSDLVGICVCCINKFGHVKSVSSDKKTLAPIHDSCTRGMTYFYVSNTYAQPKWLKHVPCVLKGTMY